LEEAGAIAHDAKNLNASCHTWYGQAVRHIRGYQYNCVEGPVNRILYLYVPKRSELWAGGSVPHHMPRS